MELDDKVCLCFHVSKRKLINYIRIEKPRRPAQLSECYGAGTGCGWCRPFIKRIFETQTGQPQEPAGAEPSADDYARGRSKYVKKGGGQPPAGAIPIDSDLDD